MAKLMVEIDIHNLSYEELQKQVITDPEPDWFDGRDPSTKRVSVDSAYLKYDSVDDSFYVFNLIGVRP